MSVEGEKFMNVKEWNSMTMKQQKEYLTTKILNAVSLDIHSNVCYLLNFCGLPQETATELSKHYNAINEIISKFQEED